MNTVDMKYVKQKQKYITFWFEVTRKIKVWVAWKDEIVPPGKRPSIYEVA